MHALLVGVSAVREGIDVPALLTEHGVTVTSVSSPKDALEVFAAMAPDLVIIDWESVAAEDASFCESVRKLPHGAEAAVLAIVRDDNSEMEAALQAGVNDFITRPLNAYSFATRIAILERWLHTRSPGRAPARTPLVAASYADLLALLEASPDPAGIHRGGVFLYANPALTESLGYDSLTGVPIKQILHPSEFAEVDRRLGSLRTTGQAAPKRQERFVRRDGSIEIGEAHSFLIQLPDGPAVVTAGRDVTRAERQEARQRHSERLASIGKLAASVAHEINNPLTLVLFNLWDLSQLVPTLSTQLQSGASQQLEERMRAIEAAALQMQALSQDLTHYARAEEQPPRPVDVGELLERAVRMISVYAKGVAEADVTMSTVPSGTVVASETRLTQVLLNLLLNAVDSVAKTAPGAARRIAARVFPQDQAVVVHISDTGPGVPSTLRERLFEPFFSTKPVGQGTGLGLAVARTIVEEMGGSLTLLDEVQPQTTTFELRLPRQGAA